jgi:hypothetical protein
MSYRNIVEAYHAFVEDQNELAEEFLTNEIYSKVMSWLQNGEPEEEFLNSLLEISSIFNEFQLFSGKLIDLSIYELLEALQVVIGTPEDKERIELHLNGACLPLLASMAEDEYRKHSQSTFSEVDFYIFDIIGGEFPHEAAQALLKQGRFPDIWRTLHYLEDLEDESVVIEILHAINDRLSMVPQKYMILAYLIYRFPERIELLLRGEDDGLGITDRRSIELIRYIYEAAKDFVRDGILTFDYLDRLNPKREAQILFALIFLFEITQSELTPAWIDVIERSMANMWTYRVQSLRGEEREQPLPHFVMSLMGRLNPDELDTLLKTSRLLPIFFENLHRYTKSTFERIISILSEYEDVFLNELELQLSLHSEGSLPRRSRRLSICARILGKRIIEKDGRYYLVEGQNL